MAQFILHTPAVWARQDLTLQEKLVLNYLWAWKARGNAITVSDAYLCEMYSINRMEMTLIIQSLLSKRFIDITTFTSTGRVIYCRPLNEENGQGPVHDVFDHLY